MQSVLSVVMIDSLPQDQAALILERLGEARVARIAEEATSVTSFYRLCIRAMGSMGGNGKTARIPSPTNAWIEVMSMKREPEMPEFSHRTIEKTVNSFGGWINMIEEFRALDIPQARFRFLAAYRGVLDD